MADDLFQMFKSIIDQDNAPVVVCNTVDEIVYMNPSAVEHYSYASGGGLVGRPIFDCHPPWANEAIAKVVRWFSESPGNNIVHTYRDEGHTKDVYMVALRDGEGRLIGYYEKHESRVPDEGATYAFERSDVDVHVDPSGGE